MSDAGFPVCADIHVKSMYWVLVSDCNSVSEYVVIHVCMLRSEDDCESVNMMMPSGGLCLWKGECGGHVWGSAGVHECEV